ncbi:MAG TPA: hypothetical protein VEK08_01570 [Planctomycetota bacterium]|nr:hypothetical protein [Planctomycetota bacterium]
MKRFLVLTVAALLATLTLSAQAADKAVAAALASAAAKLAADAKFDKARELCFKALANDEDCPEALFELGKIYERDGKTTAAGEFYVRAAREFGAGEAANPAFASKRMDAETRIKKLNPYAARFTAALADYTTELNAITKKSSDNFTLEEACDRADLLKLKAQLPPDKAPKFERPSVAVAPAKKTPEDDMTRMINRVARNTAPVTNVPPDIERVLKAAGWTTITGTWKKKAENVYEVTDGKLETPKINGAIQVILHKGGSGSLKAMVRNSQEEYLGSFSSYGSGYGYILEGSSAKLFTPSGGYSNNKFYSYMEREDPLPEAAPKNMVTVTVEEGKIDYFLNGVKKKSVNYQIAKSGPFIIQVEGTLTIEAPQAKGQ